jgi:hypothetical protein
VPIYQVGTAACWFPRGELLSTDRSHISSQIILIVLHILPPAHLRYQFAENERAPIRGVPGRAPPNLKAIRSICSEYAALARQGGAKKGSTWRVLKRPVWVGLKRDGRPPGRRAPDAKQVGTEYRSFKWRSRDRSLLAKRANRGPHAFGCEASQL